MSLAEHGQHALKKSLPTLSNSRTLQTQEVSIKKQTVKRRGRKEWESDHVASPPSPAHSEQRIETSGPDGLA